MKNKFRLINVFVVTFILVTLGCSDDEAITTNATQIQNFQVNFEENPTAGDLIGTVQKTGSANLTYTITTQSPTGALNINSNTGELSVANATLFDFETNPIITATISAIGAVNNATVTINLANINEIGDFNYGGVIFWIDPSDENHGMVCATSDQNSGIRWDNPVGPTTGVSGTSENFGTGSNNTDLIIAHEGAVETSYAAGVARAYNGGAFNDWFLPSRGEMTEMYNNLAIINSTSEANGGVSISTTVDYYWSSTRQPGTTESVYLFSFSNGLVNGGLPINSRPVRAVRAF